MSTHMYLSYGPGSTEAYGACGADLEAEGAQCTLVPFKVDCPECLATDIYKAYHHWLKMEARVQQGSLAAWRARTKAWRAYRELARGRADG